MVGSSRSGCPARTVTGRDSGRWGTGPSVGAGLRGLVRVRVVVVAAGFTM